MRIKKSLVLVLGIVGICAVLVGAIFAIAPETFSTIGGIVIICLSLASGLLLSNPISVIPLLAGILVLVLPSQVVGILFALLGISGIIVSVILWRKMHKSFLIHK